MAPLFVYFKINMTSVKYARNGVNYEISNVIYYRYATPLETVRVVEWPHFTSPLINFPCAAASLTVGNKKLESIHAAPHNHTLDTIPHIHTMMDNVLHTSTLYCTPYHNKTTQTHFFRAT